MSKAVNFLIVLVILALGITITGCAGEEISPTATPSTSPTPTPIATALFLTVTEPLDGAQVSTNSVLVAGTTSPGAVVSVMFDDEVIVADVDQNGGFSATVTLEEGPNFIEVVASDQRGNEKSSVLAVIYVP